MSSHQKRLRETLMALSHLGIIVDSCEQGRKHLKLKIRYKNGQLCIARSMTPSDSRGDANWLSMVKRWKRGLDDRPSRPGGDGHCRA